MGKTILSTNLQLGMEEKLYKGKVRDVYELDQLIIMVATDRISAFDHILPRGIPHKGEILNRIAAKMLCETADIVPNWLQAVPHPNVSIGLKCQPIMLEMVVRAYLVGHAWRIYRDGGRVICGVRMPEGMKENDPFPDPIITPATKAVSGHDEDISKSEILEKGIVAPEDYDQLEQYALALFKRGTALAEASGLILVDTKYEFGYHEGNIMLIDEVHTPDSSRYFYKAGYAERQENGVPQKHLSKEFVREWLMSENFQGQDGQKIPEMTDQVVGRISDRYMELYQQLVGEVFVPKEQEDMQSTILRYLEGRTTIQ